MRRILTSLCFCLIAAAAAAQQPPELERGFKPELAYSFNGFDSVNLFNGNLGLSIPLGSYTVSSDVSYSFMLRYAGNVWSYHWDCGDTGFVDPNPPPCEPKWYPLEENAGMGWQLSFGRLEFVGSLYGAQLPTGGTVKYVSPDGAEHSFYETLHEPKCTSSQTSNCDAVDAGVFYTRDGSYLRLKVAGGDRIVEFPSGQRLRFEHTGGVTWRLKYIYGASSVINSAGLPTTNWARIDYTDAGSTTENGQTVETPASWAITDSHGRTHSVVFNIGDTYFTKIDRIRVAAARRPEDSPSTSPHAEYDLVYGAETADGGDGAPVPIAQPCYTPDTTAAALLRRVGLPNGEAWEFRYNTNTSDCESPGTLTRAIFPTGGRINWTYQAYPFSVPEGRTASVGVKERCLRTDDLPCSLSDRPENQVEYSRYTTGSMTTTSTVTVDTYARKSTGSWTPDARRVNYFTTSYDGFIGLPFTTSVTDGTTTARYLSAEIYDCDPEGACESSPKRRQYVKYELDALMNCDPIFPCGRDRNRRVVSERTEYGADGGGYADTDHSLFDGLGHYRQTVTSGFTRSDPVRVTFTRYNPSVGTYSLTTSGGRASGYSMLPQTTPWFLRTYTTSYVRENNVSNHVEACFDAATGFLRRLRTKASPTGANGDNDLLRVYTRDSVSGYATSEEWFGGDFQQLDVQSALCAMPLPAHDQYSSRVGHTYEYGSLKTSRASGMQWKSVDHSQIDRNTGLVLESKDAAGLATTYAYDVMGRLTRVAPPGIAATTYTYVPRSTGAARVEARTGAGTARTEQRWLFDPFGRIATEKRLMAGGFWSVRRITYNATGQKAAVSEWENETGAAYAAEMKYSGYDPFGRVGTITTADGKATTFAYSGDQITTRSYEVAQPTGDARVSIDETRDRAGRLMKVVEDTEGVAATTEYQYDEGSRLETVKMLDGSTSQLRTFAYDYRGLLTSESHPESGTTSYTYDARGNLIRKTTPEASLTNAYDQAGRIDTVTHDGVGLLKNFDYDPATGRLQTAERHNRTDLGTYVVREAFGYHPSTGRLSRKDTYLERHDGATATVLERFADEYAYNSLGDVAAVTYPICISGTCATLVAPSRTVQPTYQYGSVTSIPPYTHGASAITYHPNGMVNKIQHGTVSSTPGPLFEQTLSGQMSRVGSIKVTNFCDNLTVGTPSPQPKTVAYNAPAALSVTATGATSFQWYRVSGGDAVAIAGQTSSTLAAPVTESSTYFVRVGNGVCTVDSARATVTVQSCSAPDSTITGPPTMAASTNAVASVPETSGATYQWAVAGGTILSGHGSREITFRAGCSGPIDVSVTVTSNGCTATGTHAANVAAPGVAMSAVGATSIVDGGTAQIRLTLTGAAPWTVTWSDMPAQPEIVQSSPHVRTVRPSATTSYSVSAVDGYSCAAVVTGAPVTISVRPPAPVAVQATAATTTAVTVVWSFTGSADRFGIYRSGVRVASVNATTYTFTDTTAAPSTAYVYTVRAVKSDVESDQSAGDLATTVIFEDEPVSGTMRLRTAHFGQLQTAVNAVRAAAGLPLYGFAAITAGVTPASASHVEELRAALAPARTQLGLQPIVYTRSPIVPGIVIAANDVNETRGGIR